MIIAGLVGPPRGWAPENFFPVSPPNGRVSLSDSPSHTHRASQRHRPLERCLLVDAGHSKKKIKKKMNN